MAFYQFIQHARHSLRRQDNLPRLRDFLDEVARHVSNRSDRPWNPAQCRNVRA